MADAIHEISAGERTSLQRVASLYVPVTRPGGDVEPRRLARVIEAIRARTGAALHGIKDAQPLPPSTVLRIPTLRDMPRAVLCDHADLRAALMAAGYDHANKLLLRPIESVIRVLAPYTKKSFGPDDVMRAYTLTSLFDLDGMDTRTAVYLHDAAAVGSLAALASLSEASLQSLLDRLVEGQGRPPDLATQGHAARWRASAAIQQRRRLAERVRYRPYQIPFPSKQAVARAEVPRGARPRRAARRRRPHAGAPPGPPAPLPGSGDRRELPRAGTALGPSRCRAHDGATAVPPPGRGGRSRGACGRRGGRRA